MDYLQSLCSIPDTDRNGGGSYSVENNLIRKPDPDFFIVTCRHPSSHCGFQQQVSHDLMHRMRPQADNGGTNRFRDRGFSSDVSCLSFAVHKLDALSSFLRWRIIDGERLNLETKSSLIGVNMIFSECSLDTYLNRHLFRRYERFSFVGSGRMSTAAARARRRPKMTSIFRSVITDFIVGC